jgi:hypothetical protein
MVDFFDPIIFFSDVADRTLFYTESLIFNEDNFIGAIGTPQLITGQRNTVRFFLIRSLIELNKPE